MKYYVCYMDDYISYTIGPYPNMEVAQVEADRLIAEGKTNVYITY